MAPFWRENQLVAMAKKNKIELKGERAHDLKNH
jgi:hypothetical protein